MILIAIAALAAAYQLVAVIACLVFKSHRSDSWSPVSGGVSILKPIRGLDPSMREAIASHLALDGEYELLCGVRPGDPAAELLAEFPRARLIECRTETPNGKVGALIDLARAARFQTLVVNDADIRVPSDYLATVTAPLSDPSIGLVTCLYRAEGETFASRFEALGIATDFAPSTLVARLVGVDEFAMGSTMAFRRTDLDHIGGFEAIGDYLADDFQLGHRIHALGKKCLLSQTIVTTQLSGQWGDVWRHQVRWARTIRVSNFQGYLGLPVTFATVWAVIEAVGGNWILAGAVLAARMLMATTSGWLVLRSSDVLRLWLLVPLRDLFGAAVWVAGLFGKTVVWRDQFLRLNREGRIDRGLNQHGPNKT